MEPNVAIPPESETIAQLKTARLEELRRRHFFLHHAWWANKVAEGVALLLIFGVSLWLVWPLFGTPDPGTIFAAPAIPLVAKGVSFLFSIPYHLSVNVVIGSFMAIFPLAFYFFVRQVSGRKLGALVAAAIVNLPFEPFLGARLRAVYEIVDGPYIVSLTLIPLVILTHLTFLREGKLRNLFFASLLTAVIALVSPFGALILLIFLTLATFSEMLLGRARLKLVRSISMLTVAIGFAGFWYNPVFLKLLFELTQGQEALLSLGKLVPISLFAVPVLGVFGFLLFERRADLQPLFLALFTTIVFGAVIVLGGVFPSSPLRYSAAFGVSLAFLLGIIVLRLVDYLGKVMNIEKIPFASAALPTIVFIFILGMTIIGRGSLEPRGERQVLGLWTDVRRGELWTLREQAVGGVAAVVGYVVTVMTIVSLGVVAIRTKRTSEQQQ